MNKGVFGAFVLGLFAIVLVSGFASANVAYCKIGDTGSGGKPYCSVDGNLRYIDSCYKGNCNDPLTAAKKACQAIWGVGYTGNPTFTSDGNAQTPTGSIKGTVYINAVTGISVTEYSDCSGCRARFLSLSCVCTENAKYCDGSSLHICQKGKDVAYPRGYCSGNKLAACVAGRVVESDCAAGKNAGKCVLSGGSSSSKPAQCYECDSDGDKVLKKSSAKEPGSEVCGGNDCDDSDPCIKGLKSCDADSDGFINILAFIKASASPSDRCESDIGSETTINPDCNEKDPNMPKSCNLNGNYQKCVDGKCAISCYEDTYTGEEHCCPEKIGNAQFVCDSVAVDLKTVRDSCVKDGCNVMTGQCVPENPGAKKCIKGHDTAKYARYAVKDDYQSKHEIVYTCNYCDLFSGCTSETNGQFCTRLGKTCGSVTAKDNCGATRTTDCGACLSGECKNGMCCNGCINKQCGSNGCGGSCGTCLTGQTCLSDGKCCTPKNCQQLGRTCGTASDGCGRQLNCGSCPYGKTCVDGACGVSPSGGVTGGSSGGGGCASKTCAQLGKQCGSWPDGCGGTAICSACSTGQTCNATGQCVSSGGGGGVPACTDSDNGMNYAVKGFVTAFSGSTPTQYNDFCVSNTLYELVCDDAGQKVQVAYNCPTGQTCSDGACKMSSGTTGNFILGRVISFFGRK